PFAEELEEKLGTQKGDFGEDLDLPLRWDFDEELMKIKLLGSDSKVKCEIKLLTVKERPKEAQAGASEG
ncbi:MAG: hypothetical protein JXA18_00765, partial [Chitinispirillaceae bacterium]|nr:hypothetical protein [Chitinispirillaceae bacterium]